jgi:hypothetical protein
VQYMMMFFEDPVTFASRSDQEKAGPYWGAWRAYIRELNESGITKGGAGLQPPETSTTMRLRDGRRHIEDGPHADAKEQLGGYFLIDVPDLDTALDWAARSPSAGYGSVELRPVLPPMPYA